MLAHGGPDVCARGCTHVFSAAEIASFARLLVLAALRGGLWGSLVQLEQSAPCFTLAGLIEFSRTVVR